MRGVFSVLLQGLQAKAHEDPAVPAGLLRLVIVNPGLASWATLGRPYGTWSVCPYWQNPARRENDKAFSYVSAYAAFGPPKGMKNDIRLQLLPGSAPLPLSINRSG